MVYFQYMEVLNMKNSISAKFSLWCSRFLMAAVVILIFVLPRLLDWYQQLRPLHITSRSAIVLGYYCCVPLVLWALWCIDCLLRNILKEDVFIHRNVRHIRQIRWCCAGVGAICLAAGFKYPPLLFLAVIMIFLFLVVGVVKNVLAAAVEIREENDLTV